MAVQGERTWSTKGKQVQKFEFKPFPVGEYPLVLDCSKIEIKKKQEPGKFPYINIAFTAQGTALTEGGKDRKVFHRFFVSLKPGKDGNVMPERGNQIMGLAKGFGEELEGVRILRMKDENGNDVDVLDPKGIVAWLKARDGQTVMGRVKIQKGNTEYPNDKNEVDYFMEAEQQAEEEAAAEAEEEETEETDEAEEEAEDEDAETSEEEEPAEEPEDEEEEPAPPPKKKAKVVAKAPAKKAKK